MAVDAENLVLTKRGWIGYNDIVRGDRTLGRNLEYGTLEWTEILDVEASRGSLRTLIFASRRITSTLDHPWVANVPTGSKNISDDRRVMLADFGTRTKLLLGGWYDNAGSIPAHVAKIYGLMVAGRAEVQSNGRTHAISIPQADNNTYLKRVLFDVEYRRYGAYGSYNFVISGPTAKAVIKLLNKPVSENVWNMGGYERKEFIDAVFPHSGSLDIGVWLAVYLSDLMPQYHDVVRDGLGLANYTVIDSNEPTDLFQLTTRCGSWTMLHDGQVVLTGG